MREEFTRLIILISMRVVMLSILLGLFYLDFMRLEILNIYTEAIIVNMSICGFCM